METLNQAEALCGPNVALELARRRYRAELAGHESPPTGELPEARTAWEHCLLGRSHLQAGQLPAARDEFERAIQLEPDLLWPHFYLAQCAYRQEDFQRAITAATVCVALAPQSAECRFNLAVCEQAARHLDAAIADFKAAEKLGAEPSAVHYQIALAELAGNNRAAAQAEVAQSLAHDPTYAPALSLERRLSSAPPADAPPATP